MFQNTGTSAVASRNRLLTTVAWKSKGRTEYALEGSVFIGGAVVQWLRDGLGLIRSSSDVEALAGSVPDNGGVLSRARLRRPGRAALGSVCARHDDRHHARHHGGHSPAPPWKASRFRWPICCDAMQADAGIRLKELRVDGGAARNNLLMQFQADLLGVPVVRPAVTETTALGAAYLAGLAVGFWKDRQRSLPTGAAVDAFEPAMRRGPGVCDCAADAGRAPERSRRLG